MIAHLQIITAMLLFVVCFAIGPGAIPWLITAELFAQAPRSAAVAVATLVNWLGNLVVGFTFPLIADALGTDRPSINNVRFLYLFHLVLTGHGL